MEIRRPSRRRSLWPALLGVIGLTTAALAVPPVAGAAELTVSTTADVTNGNTSSASALTTSPGPDGISLREAILATNNTSGPGTISFSAGLTGSSIPLDSALPSLTRDFTSIVGPVDGTGAPSVTVDSDEINNSPNTLTVQASYVTIRRLRFIGANPFPAAATTIGIVAGKSAFGSSGPAEVRQVRILDNLFTKESGDLGVDGGIAVGTSSWEIPGTIEDVVIARNRFEGAGMNVESESGSKIEDVTIAENEFTDFEDALEIVESGIGSLTSRTTVVRNEFVGGVLPIWIGIGSWAGPTSGNVIEDTVIERNLFSDNTNPAFEMVGGDGTGAVTSDNTVRDTRFVNNLVREGNDPNEILIVGGNNGATGNLIENLEIRSSTLSDISGSTAFSVFQNGGVGSGNAVTGVSVSDTIFDGNGFNDLDGVDPSQVHHSLTCEADFSGTNGNVCGDPDFLDPVDGDYRLQAGSPAIDAGASTGSPPTDFDCRARFDDPATTDTGSGPSTFFDIGAFEFGSPAATCSPLDTTAPATASNLIATPGSDSVALDWVNPSDPDFAGVIVRMAQGSTAPPTPESGTAISSGLGSSAAASGLATCTTYSFSVFAHDSHPNVSPPASVSTRTGADCDPPPPLPPPTGPTPVNPSPPGDAPPGETPPPGDDTPPELDLGGRSKQDADTKSGVIVTVSCPDEDCDVTASGIVTGASTLKLGSVEAFLDAGDEVKLKLKASKKVRQKINAALEEAKRLKAKVTVRASDEAGNQTTAKGSYKLK